MVLSSPDGQANRREGLASLVLWHAQADEPFAGWRPASRVWWGCVGSGVLARFAGRGRFARPSMSRRCPSGHQLCLEGALRDVERPHGALRDIGHVSKVPFGTLGSDPNRAHGPRSAANPAQGHPSKPQHNRQPPTVARTQPMKPLSRNQSAATFSGAAPSTLTCSFNASSVLSSSASAIGVNTSSSSGYLVASSVRMVIAGL
jgi:hypothetical protein